MRKIFISFFVIFLIGSVAAQNFSITLFAEDSLGNKDSVLFGLNELATLGIDSELGEQQVSSTLNEPIDMRIILRDESHPHCSHNFFDDYFFNEPINWDINVDLKTDFRPFENHFHSPNTVFEIKVYSKHFPVKIYGDFSNGFNYSMFDSFSTIFLLDSLCVRTTQKSLNQQIQDSIFSIYTNKETILINFEHEVGINERLKNFVQFYPNPTINFFIIESESQITTEIYSLSGQFLKSSTKKQIDISKFKRGMYLVLFKNSKNSYTQNEILIKE